MTAEASLTMQEEVVVHISRMPAIEPELHQLWSGTSQLNTKNSMQSKAPEYLSKEVHVLGT